MARLEPKKDREQLLKDKRKLTRKMTFMKVLKAIEIVVLIYIAIKLSGV